MKKIYSKCFWILLIFLLFPNTAYASEETKTTSDGFVYRYFDEAQDSIEIVGYEGEESRITIPGEIESLPVITIGEEAFYCNESVEEVIFEENVESIGLKSFYECENLTSVTFCNSIEDISAEAFAYCYNLSDVILPENIREIGADCFTETAIASITIPESVSLIWNNAFGACGNLLSIDVAESNQNYSSADGVLYNKAQTKLICCPSGKSSVDISDTVLQIESQAFYFADKIEEIILPESVSRIGDEAFFGASIKQIAIPKNVSSIGNYAFYACSSLTDIEVETENIFYSSEDGVLYDKQKTKLICCPSQKEDIVIPETVHEIGAASFGCCDRLTMLVLPNHVTSIGEEAFAWAENLSYLYVPDSVTEIGRAALSSVLRVDCNAQSFAEQYAIENELNYTIHVHTMGEDRACRICGAKIPLAAGKFALVKSFLQEKGQTDSNGNKYFQEILNGSNATSGIATISYIENEAKFRFCYEDVKNNRTNSTITMRIEENGSQTVTVDYSHDIFSLNASATFDVERHTPDGDEYFEKTDSNILNNSEIQDLCNAALRVAFNGWDAVLLKNFGLDVTMADMGFTSYEEAGTHTWDSGAVTKQPTCLEKGVRTYTCMICGSERSEEIEGQHQWKKEYTIDKEATSTEAGAKSIHCSICNTILHGSEQIIPKLDGGVTNYHVKEFQVITAATSKKISLKKLKKKAQSFYISAKSTSGGKVKYKLAKKNKNIKFAASSGKITVKKGTKKGTYKIRVKMSVSENEKYKEYSTTKTITIKVR